MSLPPWSPRSPRDPWKRLKFTDSTKFPSMVQKCYIVEARQTSSASGVSDVYFNYIACSDAELRDHIAKPLVSQSRTDNGTRHWGFRLIISLRDDSYLLEDQPFDLPSSFDICTFSMAKSTFKAILENLDIELRFLESITSLQDDSMFSFDLKEQKTQTLSYVMRTERALPSDLALAVSCTAGDDGTVTTGLIHGCRDNEAKQIMKWLEQASTALQHPSLMALLLAEIQYERHSHISREYWRRYNDLFVEIQNKARLLTTTLPAAGDKVQGLSEIAGWLGDIFGMHRKHGSMHRYSCAFKANLDLLLDLTGKTSTTDELEFKARATSITVRLQQIATGYKDLEQQALILKDGASLLLTTMWSLIAQKDSQIAQRANIINQEVATSNRIIAKASGQDSSAMKALAVLTMVFLPSTTLAAIFDLPIFDWEARRFWPIARPSTWIFCILSAVLTFLVLYMWRFWFLGTIWEKDVVEGNSTPYSMVDRLLLRRHDRQKVPGLEAENASASIGHPSGAIMEQGDSSSNIVAQARQR